MINIVTPAKSGSKSHIFITREPRTNDPVTLCGRDLTTDPTRSTAPAMVGTSDAIYDNFCKTCVKRWNETAEYRSHVDAMIKLNEALDDYQAPDDWLDDFLPDSAVEAYDVTDEGLVPLKLTHGQVKHSRDQKREAMKRRVKMIMGS